jgi:DNA-directed RNA polymerase III subunit RPC6
MDSEIADAAKLDILKEALYEEVRNHGSEARLFSQKDLVDLNVVPKENVMLLVRVIQGLCDDKLLVGVTSQSGIAWRWRSREDAKK